MKALFALVFLLTLIWSEPIHAQSRWRTIAFDAAFEPNAEGVYHLRERWHSTEPGDTIALKDNARLVAIGLNITLGMLGVHRIYLGTDVKIPIVYTLTFGGGGVLWLVDLAFLITTKDIRPFMDNPHLFMFSRK